MFIVVASIFWRSAILRHERNSTTTTILSSSMSGLNTMAAFALSVNRNKVFLECNDWHDLHSRVTTAHSATPHRRGERDFIGPLAPQPVPNLRHSQDVGRHYRLLIRA